MKELNIKIKDEYITLSQLLKLAGLVDSGAQAKMYILDGLVKYNNEVCTMRNKKVYIKDTVTFGDTNIKVINK